MWTDYHYQIKICLTRHVHQHTCCTTFKKISIPYLCSIFMTNEQKRSEAMKVPYIAGSTGQEVSRLVVPGFKAVKETLN